MYFDYDFFLSSSIQRYGGGGRTVVLSGPTAVGKDTLLNDLPSHLGDCHVRHIRSVTTKPPRLNEVGHPEYDHLDQEQFMKLVSAGELAEFTEYTRGSGDVVRFGTTKQSLAPQETGEIGIWKVSLDRFAGITEKLQSEHESVSKSVKLVMLGSSRLSVLKDRARNRAVDSDEWNNRLRINFLQRMRLEYQLWLQISKVVMPYILVTDELPSTVLTAFINKISE